jgi:addiction module HigA family antidote
MSPTTALTPGAGRDPRAALAAPATKVPLSAPAGVPCRAPLHPGRFLERHYLQPLAVTQTEAARLLGVSRRRVNELVQGRRAMTADTAIRCAQVFGLPAADWLALQSGWDSYAAWKHLRHAQRGQR